MPTERDLLIAQRDAMQQTITEAVTIAEAASLPSSSIPLGGTTNQVLSKKSNTDLDTKWMTQTSYFPSGW